MIAKPPQSISSIELVSVPADYGRGANDGAYYPVGLLSVGTQLRRMIPEMTVSVIDMHHEPNFQPSSDLVGISANSTLNYCNVLDLAQRSKDAGASVVVGGPHVTLLAEQVLYNRRGLIDYVIRGRGEESFVSLIEALRAGSDLQSVPSLSWYSDNRIVHNPSIKKAWEYEKFLPLDMSMLRCGLSSYWETFRRRIDPCVDASFVTFTHFGCGYREKMRQRRSFTKSIAGWCTYCSLNDPLVARSGEAIITEILSLLKSARIAPGANILLKCYGDNVGTQQAMLHNLASAIQRSNKWRSYCINWTFYAQSSCVSRNLIDLLVRIGTKNLFIGFDTADNRIQRLNGLGTSLAVHKRAARLCRDSGISIQAGFVLGCAGENQQSLNKTLCFAEELSAQGVLERINSAILFMIPGSPAYSLLCEKEPWIKGLDVLPTEELQWLWIRHFCPQLGKNPSDGLAILRKMANYLDDLSPNHHASMGYVSNRLLATCETIEVQR